MKYLLIIFSICLASVLSGCSLVPTNDVNELNLIEAGGFDLSKKGQITGTTFFPVFRSTGAPEYRAISANGETIKRVRERIDSQVRYRLISGQMRLVTFSLDLAKKGIYPIIDTFNRDPAVGNLVQIAIVDGQAAELFSLKQYQKENVALYLYDLLLHNSENGPFPYTDFSTFVYQYFEVGKDPYLPVLKIVNDRIKITGIAIFKRDKVVKIIPWKYVFMFKSMLEDYKQGLQQFKVDGEYVAIDNVNSKNKYEVKFKKGIPEITLSLKMNARIQEYTGSRPIMFPKHIKELNKRITKDFEKNGQELISLLQKDNLDPIGFGSMVEAHQRDFDPKKWHKQYPNVKIKFKVDFDLLHTGIVE